MKLLYTLIVAPLLLNLAAPNALATSAEIKKLENSRKLESTGKCVGCDLSGSSFVGIDFTGISVDLRKANLNGANFAGAIMPKADLSEVSAAGANFLGTDLQGAILKDAHLVYANLVKVKLNNAILEHTDLQGANLAEADLSGATITRTDFVGANLYKIRTSTNIKDSALGNHFKEQKKGILTVLQNGVAEISKPVGDPGYESSRRTIRKFRIPNWMSYPNNSVPGTFRYYDPQNPNLILELW